MATPDTSTLTSSAQIFTTYTLPQIRAVHKSLHTQIDEKSARLRTQVGNSYRQLLGTADTIVQMRADMISAQEVLGRMSGQCGRGIIENKATGLGRFRGNDEKEKELSQAARVKLLRACGLAVRRLLKAGTTRDAEAGRADRLVLAAKVFVLSRLLVSSFGDLKMLDYEVKSVIEATKKSLDGLRRKLVRAIEKVLQRTREGADITDTVKALSAYSLSSSSGTKDVLRRFLSLRAEAIAYEFEYEEHEKHKGTGNILKGLDLYTKTLVDVQALIPNKLPDALLELKRKPLLADESLRSLEGLRLDILERWCGDEIRYFTPFIRHDDLDGQQAKEMLTSWADKGQETILRGLNKILENISEFKAIMDLRTSTLQRWIGNGGKPKGFDPSIMFESLRQAINDHMLQLIETKVVKLRLVGAEVATTLEAWQSGVTDRQRGMWDDEILDMDLSASSAQVTQEIITRFYGRNDAVARAVVGFESWHHIVDNVGDLADQLRSQRWDNDVDEIEDEEVIEARQSLLSKEDPQLLHTRLNETLTKAFQELDEQLTTLWQNRKDGLDDGQIAKYILRILRDIRSHLPKLDGVQSFGLHNVPSLHEKLAAHVSVTPLEEFATAILTQKRVVGRALWEGEPALPTQPSPGTFKLLRNITMSMGNAGVDLWTPAAVETLKRVLSRRLAEIWRKELTTRVLEADTTTPAVEISEDKTSETDADGNKAGEETKVEPAQTPGRSNDVFVQWLADINLLQHFLDVGNDNDGDKAMKDLTSEVLEMTGLDSEAQGRLGKASDEYWKRTSLLFGLLAS
ncbi:hypothetical protein GGR50DRAFT_125747 [Xylaria sp. CBS 124048]|nr:hypothetical protein GGR50DRAFT_125747 [Xylaria sp. CBS 124048]